MQKRQHKKKVIYLCSEKIIQKMEKFRFLDRGGWF